MSLFDLPPIFIAIAVVFLALQIFLSYVFADYATQFIKRRMKDQVSLSWAIFFSFSSMTAMVSLTNMLNGERHNVALMVILAIGHAGVFLRHWQKSRRTGREVLTP